MKGVNRLKWVNVQLTLDEKDRAGNDSQRFLLTSLSGELVEGQLLAIMGPSGCGKTSLLSVLSGRVTQNSKLTLTGSVTINGESINTAKLSTKIACVAQDDSLFAYLTVRETLHLAAYFSKGSGTSRERIDSIVDALMTELSLTKSSETIIGSATRRGISGGEYKRVLVGKEMMKKPKTIFLDEPTSGLDSFQAFAVIESMKTLAMNGKVVVAVIHQPRSSIFAMFDQLLLLSAGKLMYFGPADEAVGYFSSLGYVCPEHYNPADFFLDLLSVNYKSPALEKESSARIETIGQQWGHLSTKHQQRQRHGTSTSLPAFMRGAPLSRSRYPEEVKESDIDPPETKQEHIDGDDADQDNDNNNNNDSDANADADAEHRARTNFLSTRSDTSPSGAWNRTRGWLSDFALLLWRACAENMRNYGSIVIRSVTVLFYAMVLSLIYQNLDFSQQSIQDRTGLLYFMLINQSFTPLFVLLDVFPSEKVIVSREILSGSYTASAYFVSRVIAELPLQIVLTGTYSTIIYWATGLQPYADRYFIFLVTILLSTFTAMALGFMVSAASPSKLIAGAVGPPILIILLLFGGFYINTESLPAGSEWVRYLSLIYWGFQALTVNEFRGETFECDAATAATVGCIHTGDQQILKLSFEDSEIGMALGMLAVLIFGFLTLAYLALLLNREQYMKIRAPVKLSADPGLASHMGTPSADNHEEEDLDTPRGPGAFELDLAPPEGQQSPAARQQEEQRRTSTRADHHSNRVGGRWFPWRWWRQSSSGMPSGSSDDGGASGRASGRVDGRDDGRDGNYLSRGVSGGSRSGNEPSEANFAAAWMALGVNKVG